MSQLNFLMKIDIFYIYVEQDSLKHYVEVNSTYSTPWTQQTNLVIFKSWLNARFVEAMTRQ